MSMNSNFNNNKSSFSKVGAFRENGESSFYYKNKMMNGRYGHSPNERVSSMVSQTVHSIMNSASLDSCPSGSSSVDHSNSISQNLSRFSIQEDRTKFVLVLYCGGTIGMKNKNGVYVPEPQYLEKELRRLPIFHDSSFPVHNMKHEKMDQQNILVLPPTNDGQRIIYTVNEYDPLLDSSNMGYDDYVKIAKDIQENYTYYDGFVILHGTDTMAFTASGLSFMFENLGKPIILTGSQVPIFELRSDGRSNFINALILAGTCLIPEVTLFFNYTLFRGNRSTKVDNKSFAAFDSPNVDPLVKVEIDIKVNWDDVFRTPGMNRFRVSMKMCPDVGVLRIFPNITVNTVRAFFQPPMMGVILQTYGQGNGPDTRKDLMEVIKEACDRGVIVVNITQCTKGTVSPLYAAGKALADVGVTSGSDMTVEAALMKLSYLLGKDELSLQEKRKMMGLNLRGELSEVLVEDMERTHISLLENLAEAMRIGSVQEVRLLESEMFPYLLCSAAQAGSIPALEKLRKAGAHFNMCDYDGRTPLHIACCNGNVEVVRYLLELGAPVHQKDRFNYSPLDNALQFKQTEVVPLLTQTGAHINIMTPKLVNTFIAVLLTVAMSSALYDYPAHTTSVDLASHSSNIFDSYIPALFESFSQQHSELLAKMAVLSDELSVVKMWCDAGADLNLGGYEGRTPLHMAVSFELLDKVQLLLGRGADPLRPDNYDRTPYSEAKERNLTEIVKEIENVILMYDLCPSA